MSEQQNKGPDEYAKTMDHVFVVDEFGLRHNGLVTNGWGGDSRFPAINVVYVLADVKKTDGYGRQKEHLCSCSHASTTPAPGRYWYKDAAWAKPTERDAYSIQAEGARLERQQYEEDTALRKEASAAYEAAGKPGSETLEAVSEKFKPRWAEHEAKWKAIWKDRR